MTWGKPGNKLVWSIPISIFFGWLLHRIGVVSRENAIRDSCQALPSDYFGETSISLGDEGVSITTPYHEIKHGWKLINTIKTSNEFTFFCFGSHLVFSIPTAALGSQASEFIAQVENLMSKAQQPASTESKS